MVDGIPTLFGDADDVQLSLPELQAAVHDCARAGHSNPVVLKEIQLAVYESAWVLSCKLPASLIITQFLAVVACFIHPVFNCYIGLHPS